LLFRTQSNSLLGSVDTAENPAQSNRLGAEDSTLLGGEVLAGGDSAPLVLVHLASDLVGLGDLDALDVGVDAGDLELGYLNALVGGKDAERDVEGERVVAVVGHHGDADVLLLLDGYGHGAGDGEDAGENGRGVHNCGGVLKVLEIDCLSVDC
jgi:hypothetical protein